GTTSAAKCVQVSFAMIEYEVLTGYPQLFRRQDSTTDFCLQRTKQDSVATSASRGQYGHGQLQDDLRATTSGGTRGAEGAQQVGADQNPAAAEIR
ncbi:unnamed protein product, partial [Amoebophrya sp. A120]